MDRRRKRGGQEREEVTAVDAITILGLPKAEINYILSAPTLDRAVHRWRWRLAWFRSCWRKVASHHHPDHGGDRYDFHRAAAAWDLVSHQDFVVELWTSAQERDILKGQGVFEFRDPAFLRRM